MCPDAIGDICFIAKHDVRLDVSTDLQGDWDISFRYTNLFLVLAWWQLVLLLDGLYVTPVISINDSDSSVEFHMSLIATQIFLRLVDD